MMPGAAPYLPSALATVLECAKADPEAELQEQIVTMLSAYKLSVLDSREVFSGSPRRSVDTHAEVLTNMRNDRRQLPKLQLALVATLPPMPSMEDCRVVSGQLEAQIPVVEGIIAARQDEFARVQVEEKTASGRFTEELTALDEQLESLLKREAELRAELEDVQKQVADTETVRRDLSKQGEQEMKSISLRKRIADTEMQERSKLADSLRRAADTWARFMENMHLDYIEATHLAHDSAHAWLEKRLEEMCAHLTAHCENVKRASAELVSRGASSLLASEAWKVARGDATHFLQEAAQFLAAFPAALHQVHAKKLDEIVQLREEVQRICDEHSKETADTTLTSTTMVAPGSGSLGRSTAQKRQSMRESQRSTEDLLTQSVDSGGRLALPSQRGSVGPPLSRSDSPITPVPAPAAAPPSTNASGVAKFSLPSERFTPK